MWHPHLARDLRARRPCHVAKIHQNLMAVIQCWIKSLSITQLHNLTGGESRGPSPLKVVQTGVRLVICAILARRMRAGEHHTQSEGLAESSRWSESAETT